MVQLQLKITQTNLPCRDMIHIGQNDIAVLMLGVLAIRPRCGEWHMNQIHIDVCQLQIGQRFFQAFFNVARTIAVLWQFSGDENILTLELSRVEPFFEHFANHFLILVDGSAVEVTVA